MAWRLADRVSFAKSSQSVNAKSCSVCGSFSPFFGFDVAPSLPNLLSAVAITAIALI
jgi:hypothetical protein